MFLRKREKIQPDFYYQTFNDLTDMHNFFQFYLKSCIAFVYQQQLVELKKIYQCLDLAAYVYLEVCFKDVMH